MLATNPRIFAGQRFRVVSGAIATVFQYRKRRNGKLVFINETTGGREAIHATSFGEQREARQIEELPDGPKFPLKSELALLDASESGFSYTKRRAIKAAQKRINRLMTLRFYLVRADQNGVSTSIGPLDDLVQEYAEEARKHGFLWLPSGSHLKKAARTYGSRGDRQVHYFLKDAPRRSRYDVMAHLKEQMLEKYWNCSWEVYDAHSWLGGEILKENEKRSALRAKRSANSQIPDCECDWPYPVYETVRTWISESETPELLAKKFSDRQSRRATRARGEHFTARYPLQTVAYDFTQIDIWCNVLNTKGVKIGTARPWLLIFIDIYTRMILAAYLSFEPPSTYTLCEGMKQMLRPKKKLVERFGVRPATDGWGRPSNLCGDNGVEGVGISFDMACDVANIDHVLAPVSNPEFKSIVERVFYSMNRGLWRKAPGGIRYKPSEAAAREHKPRKEAAWSIEKAEEVMWLWIFLYHSKKHRGIDMPPAMRWEEGITECDRQTLGPDHLIDRLFGKRKRVSVTAQGVRLHGERFTDQDVITEILEWCAQEREERDQPREGEMNSYNVRGTIVENLEDCSYVSIYHPGLQRYVLLQNVDKEVLPGTSWRKRRADRLEKKRRIDQATSSSELKKWKAELSSEFVMNPPADKPLSRQVLRDAAFERMQLVKGTDVNVVSVQPTIEGRASAAVLNVEMMENHTLDEPPSGRGPTQASVAKAAQTRLQKAELERAEEPEVPLVQEAGLDFGAFSIGDPKAYFAGRSNRGVG